MKKNKDIIKRKSSSSGLLCTGIVFCSSFVVVALLCIIAGVVEYTTNFVPPPPSMFIFLGILACIPLLIAALYYWALTKIVYISEFYKDKIVFRKLNGKFLREVPFSEIKRICLVQEGMPIYTYLPRYYTFDIPGIEPNVHSLYRITCDAKNEKFLKEVMPMFEIPPADSPFLPL